VVPLPPLLGKWTGGGSLSNASTLALRWVGDVLVGENLTSNMANYIKCKELQLKYEFLKYNLKIQQTDKQKPHRLVYLGFIAFLTYIIAGF